MSGAVIRALFVLPPILLLAACGDSPPPRPAAVSSQPVPQHRAPLKEPGLSGVIGADAESLIREFGPPRLDIREGDARKLQWSGTACVLDAYLYPGERGTRATATYLDARRGDGRDVDRAACVAALRKN
jgi:hypothetical protein